MSSLLHFDWRKSFLKFFFSLASIFFLLSPFPLIFFKTWYGDSYFLTVEKWAGLYRNIWSPPRSRRMGICSRSFFCPPSSHEKKNRLILWEFLAWKSVVRIFFISFSPGLRRDPLANLVWYFFIHRKNPAYGWVDSFRKSCNSYLTFPTDHVTYFTSVRRFTSPDIIKFIDRRTSRLFNCKRR